MAGPSWSSHSGALVWAIVPERGAGTGRHVGVVGGQVVGAPCVEARSGAKRIQVLANSAIATVLVIVLAIMTGGQDQCLDSNGSKVITGIIGAIIGHYCCCNGDTWSSEIGVLSDEQPRLVTTLKERYKWWSDLTRTSAATAGGLTIGLTFVAVGLMTADCSFDMSLQQLLVIPISAAAGLLGSLIDSFLGATLQFSGYCSVRKKVNISMTS
ncbi:transmembrane protein 19-like [Hordeum vulgare]|nr:transmembrane protein 19-like [Hordeum vulgare]